MTSADDSTSIQVHMLVKTSGLASILKSAGSTCMWATPKTKDGKIDQSWKMIWLDPKTEPQSAAIALAKVPESVGLTKIKGRYAIRVAKANFGCAWNSLFPGVQPPDLLDATTTWRVEALPYGVTREMIQEWSKHNAWPIKPLRAVGPRSWVVGAAVAPPKPTMFFNSEPLLIREITSKPAPVNPIIAGPRPKAQTAELPQLKGDPWAQTASSPWANYKGPQQAGHHLQSQPTAVGPTEQKFQAQEDRIAKLEDALQGVQKEQKVAMDAVSSLHADVRKRDDQIKSHLDNRLAAVKQELDSSFATALKQQSNSWEAGFLELKKLLAKSDKRPREPDDNMED